jgi:hypothetical protein
MTNREYLEMELAYTLQKYGEDASLTRNIKRQLREIEQSRLIRPSALEMQQFQAGVRKAKVSKKPGPPL